MKFIHRVLVVSATALCTTFAAGPLPSVLENQGVAYAENTRPAHSVMAPNRFAAQWLVGSDAGGDLITGWGEAPPASLVYLDITHVYVLFSPETDEFIITWESAADIPHEAAGSQWAHRIVREQWALYASDYAFNVQRTDISPYFDVFVDDYDSWRQPTVSAEAQIQGRFLTVTFPTSVVPRLNAQSSWYASASDNLGYEDRTNRYQYLAPR